MFCISYNYVYCKVNTDHRVEDTTAYKHFAMVSNATALPSLVKNRRENGPLLFVKPSFKIYKLTELFKCVPEHFHLFMFNNKMYSFTFVYNKFDVSQY